MKRIFIDGLSGMAQGLFATLIIGTIIQQIGMFVGGNYGDLIYLIGKVAAALQEQVLVSEWQGSWRLSSLLQFVQLLLV